MNDDISEQGEVTPQKSVTVLVPETPSPVFSGWRKTNSISSNGFSNISPVLGEGSPHFQNSGRDRKEFSVGHREDVKRSSFISRKKQAAFDKLRSIRNRRKEERTTSGNSKKFRRSRPFDMWPSESESELEEMDLSDAHSNDADTLSDLLNKSGGQGDEKFNRNTSVVNTSPHKPPSPQKYFYHGLSQNDPSTDPEAKSSPYVPLRNRLKLGLLKSFSGFSRTSNDCPVEINDVTPAHTETNKHTGIVRSPVSNVKRKKRIAPYLSPGFMSARKFAESDMSFATSCTAKTDKHNDRVDCEKSCGKPTLISEVTEKKKHKHHELRDVNSTSGGAMGNLPNSQTDASGLDKRRFKGTRKECTKGFSPDVELMASNFYRKSPIKRREDKTDGLAQNKMAVSPKKVKSTDSCSANTVLKVNPDRANRSSERNATPLRKRKKVSNERSNSGVAAISSATEIDCDDEDVIAVGQLETDEMMARKLQEELDREFALSLAQTQSPGHQRAPQGRVRTGPVSSGFDDNIFRLNEDYSPYEERSVQNFPFMAQGNWGTSPLALLTRHLTMREDPPTQWMSTTGTGGRRTRPTRRSTRGRMSHVSRMVGLNSPGFNGEDYEALLDLAETIGDVKPKGLTKQQIECLPVRKFVPRSGESSRDKECLVCMCEFESEEKLRILTCFHDFHAACIDKWLKTNNTCPICRVEVKLE